MPKANHATTTKGLLLRILRSAFLDKMLDHLKLKNDASLARAMLVAPPIISKMRNVDLPFGSDYIIIAHELTGWSIEDIKIELELTTIQARIAAARVAGTYIEPLKMRGFEATEPEHHPV